MKGFLLSLAMLSTLAISGCGEAPDDGDDEPAEEEATPGSVFGSTSSDGDKSDALEARELVWRSDLSEDVSIEDVVQRGRATVTGTTDTEVVWSANRILLHPRKGETVNISIDSPDWWTDLTQNVAFGVFYSLDGTEDFKRLIIDAEPAPGQEIEIFIYESIEYDPLTQRAEVDFVVPTNRGTIRKSASLPLRGLDGEDVGWAVLPIPTGQWGELDGEYPYVLEADCGGVACTSER